MPDRQTADALFEYWTLCEERDELDRQIATRRKVLDEWFDEHPDEDSLPLEGQGAVVRRTYRVRSYDVKAIAESNDLLFRRLLDLSVLDIDRKRLDANAELIAMKVPYTEGERTRIERVRSR